jgi:uncharacterized repeat protein (TIGR03806 family)
MKKLNLLLIVAFIFTALSCGGDDSPGVVIDTQSPAAPLNLIVSNITGSSALLSWDAATDNVGVISYQVYENGVLAETNITATSFSPSALTEGSDYSYYVTATDAAGNESGASNTTTFRTQEAPLVFEPTLSEMRVFTGTMADLIPADGVQLFELNSALFTDYAAKQRLIRLPNGQSMRYNNSELFPIFPDNTLLAKTFYYNVDETNPNSPKQIIETRISIKVNGLWSMGTYVWNQAQTEATYNEAGASLPVSYMDSNGITQNIDYVIPTQANCITCHSNATVVTPIGPKLRNWNFTPSYTTQNQLDYFQSIGILEGVNVTNVSVLPDWTDSTLDIFSRGRAYIDINCAHCHQPGGPVINFGLDFRLETPFDDTGIYPNRGEIEERVQSTVPTYRMPQLGRSVVHEEAVVMLLEYLDAL